MSKFIPLGPIVLCLVLILLAGPVAAKGGGIALVRDAEIEATIRSYAAPLFRAAGLDPNAVEIYLVKDAAINAFVAGGQKLFLNTGLLMKSESANQVVGVIAHEIGHIQGAHLVRVQDAMRNATAESILALVVGIAAGLASGEPGLGTAAVLAGQDIATRNFLRYSRTQEGAADAAALRLLDATGQSARGLAAFFRSLEDQELLAVGRQDPYLRTHPLSRDRIEAIEAHVRRSPHSDAVDPPAYRVSHARMLAKLHGFLSPPSLVYRLYPDNDQSEPARYARAVAYHRDNQPEAALADVDSLIADRPQDPYYLELKGQILFERGRAAEALPAYEAAVAAAPGEALLRIDLARVQLALEDPRYREPAIHNLRAGLVREADNAFAWRQLAIAYGQSGDAGRSAWALAEEAALRKNWSEAIYHAGKAEITLPAAAPERLKAQDIKVQARHQLDADR